jgi:hypothetical protein
MEVSHILVGGLTAIALALLVWIEIRSRRESAEQPEQQSVPIAFADPQPPKKKRRSRR